MGHARFSNKKKRVISYVLAGIILLIAALVVLELTGTTNLVGNKHGASADERELETTSKLPSAQSDYTGANDDREAGNSVSEDEGSAAINDGAPGQSVDRSQRLASSSGEITVFGFSKGMLIQDGHTFAGESSLGNVSFRVIDSTSGVIASGVLNVVNGQFSGALSVKTGATEGRLDFYGTKADGSEFSSIEIPIRFK